MSDTATRSQDSDAFWQEVQEAFEREPIPVLPPPPPPPPLPSFIRRHVTLLSVAAGGIFSIICLVVWITSTPPIPDIPTFPEPLFGVFNWITLKTSVEGRSKPNGPVTEHWDPGTKLFVISYTVRKTPSGGFIPDHHWVIIKTDPHDQLPKYAAFDEIAPSLPPALADGTIGQSKSRPLGSQ